MMKRNLIAVVLVVALAVALLAAPVLAGLTVDPDEDGFLKITEMDGAVTYTFTVTDGPLLADSNITIDAKIPGLPESDLSILDTFVASGDLTDANVVVDNVAHDGKWGRSIAVVNGRKVLNLTISGRDAAEDETVTVTFTGAGGNPWAFDAEYDDPDSITLGAIRSDEPAADPTIFNLRFKIPPGTLDVVPAGQITTTTGGMWANFSITDAPIIEGGTITIHVALLKPYVASGDLTDANVVVEDTVAGPTGWTCTVAGDILTLTSTGGRTPVGSWVNVRFTGATNPWTPDTDGEKEVLLKAVRTDSGEESDTFTFKIETTPPAGYDVVADFTATPTSDIARLTVAFNDKSQGNPTSWSWDFNNDGVIDSTVQNPTHTYNDVGTYAVSLTARNDYSSHTKSTTKDVNDIHVLNGTIVTATTSIAGLTTEIVGGQQWVTVHTDILPAARNPGNSQLEILHAGNGWKNITIYGTFDQVGNMIMGPVTGVRLLSEDIAPSTPPFSDATGPQSSFNYSIDLATYPPDATLTTKIWEGVIEEYHYKFIQIADAQTPKAAVIGTAYTAKVTKTNFPSGTAAKIHMSVCSTWFEPGGAGNGGWPLIIRISDDGSEGQVLETDWLYTDPVKKLGYYEADSPRGLSTFGFYSIDRTNNIYQLIALTVAQAASPPSESTSESSTGQITSAAGAKGLEEPGLIGQAAPPADQGQMATIYANPDGIITQATTLKSTDGIAAVNVDLGVVAKGADNNPLTSISIAAVSEQDVPALSGATVSYAGMAYNLQPDGATFSPAISISFTVPAGQAGQDFTIRTYDPVSHSWQALPTTYDPATGTVTAQVSHFCLVAVFTKLVTTAAPTLAATPIVTPQIPTTLKPPSPTIATTFLGIVLTVINLLVTNPVLIAGIAVLAVGIVIMVWKQRRDRLYPKP